jgi:hypothetical protein
VEYAKVCVKANGRFVVTNPSPVKLDATERSHVLRRRGPASLGRLKMDRLARPRGALRGRQAGGTCAHHVEAHPIP